VTPSVTSPGGPAPDRVAALHAARPHLKYVAGQQRGYVVLDLTPERLQADWWFVPTITQRSSDESRAKSLASEAGQPHLVEVATPVTGGDVDPAPRL
jgi:alkaline phosphatase D